MSTATAVRSVARSAVRLPGATRPAPPLVATAPVPLPVVTFAFEATRDPALGGADATLRAQARPRDRQAWRSLAASGLVHGALLAGLLVLVQPQEGLLRGGPQAVEVDVLVLGPADQAASEPAPGAPAGDTAQQVEPAAETEALPTSPASPAAEARAPDAIRSTDPAEDAPAPALAPQEQPDEPDAAGLDPTARVDSAPPDHRPVETPVQESPPPAPEPEGTEAALLAPEPEAAPMAAAEPAPAPVMEQPSRPVPAPARRVPATPPTIRETAARVPPPRRTRSTSTAVPPAAAERRGQGDAAARQAASETGGTGGAAAEAGTVEVATYRARVLAHLARFKVYPAGARDRGVEGRATLSFVVSRDGAVVSSALSESSGAPALDEATLTMLRRATPFPPMPAGGPPTMSFRTAVRYDLRS